MVLELVWLQFATQKCFSICNGGFEPPNPFLCVRHWSWVHTLVNEVTLRRARLVLGCVRKPTRYVTGHPGTLSLLPSVGRQMNSDQRMLILCGWGVKAGMAN